MNSRTMGFRVRENGRLAHPPGAGRARRRWLPACLLALLLPLAAAAQIGATFPIDPAYRPLTRQDVDVVIYGTTTSGIGALRGLQLAQVVYGRPLRIALISSGRLLESPLAQGLGIEDLYDPDVYVSGFYKEWRDAILTYYRARGIEPVNHRGRLVHEPEVANEILWGFINRNGRGRTGVSFFAGRLVEAGDGEERYVLVELEDGRRVRLQSRYLIDASTEADLARMLGASYRMGRSESIYNDVTGPSPPSPTRENGWISAPQRLSALLTLKVFHWGLPLLEQFEEVHYKPVSYPPRVLRNLGRAAEFRTSWSMTVARLPNGKRELNESWTDYPGDTASFLWVLFPERRAEIRGKAVDWSLNWVKRLREFGYSDLWVASIPARPYIREGPRLVAQDYYRLGDILAGAVRQPIALGHYALYDRHDGRFPSQLGTATVRVPMGITMPRGHPYLLVSTAVATDWQAYSSPVRMEATRANIGGAVGVMIAVAEAWGIPAHAVWYDEVRRELLRQGYRF